jgi:ABC-2 type transport system ATP-binding protein
MSDMIAISLRNIQKIYDRKVILDNISLDVPAGQITGISGPNGAGKSVLLRIICGLVKPTRGEVHVLGCQVGKTCDFPPETGALIDSPGFLLDKSARENLELLAKISRRADADRISDVLKITGLDPDDRRPVKVYSNGMQKRLGIAQAILEKPKLVILDEPTDAIDQAGWRGVYEYLIKLKEDGTTILFSSNNLDEIAILSDQAYVLQEGCLQQSDLDA